MPKNASQAEPIVLAIPKGRVLEQLTPVFQQAGIGTRALTKKSRKLIREDSGSDVRFLLLKPDDVPTYVEYGVADLGIVGRDVIWEQGYDLYVPVDLGIGRCRMVVAGMPDTTYPPKPRGRPLRVATKFTNIARRHFVSKGHAIEPIFVQSSVELAPLTGLADVIVDLVETGETLRQNGLIEFEPVCHVSSVVVANRVGLKLKLPRIKPLLKALRKATA